MTNPRDIVANGAPIELVFKDLASAPFIAPNAAGVSVTAGNFYLDLAFMDPADIVEAMKKATGNHPPKVSGRVLTRVVLSPDTANQIVGLLVQQLSAMAQAQATLQAQAVARFQQPGQEQTEERP